MARHDIRGLGDKFHPTCLFTFLEKSSPIWSEFSSTNEFFFSFAGNIAIEFITMSYTSFLVMRERATESILGTL